MIPLVAFGPMILAAADTPTADFTTFLAWGSTLLTTLLTWMGDVLNWMLARPIVFVGLVMMLIVAAIGTLRHIIGGSAKKENPSEG